MDAADGDVEIGELAEALAELESDGDTYGQRDRKRTYNALYQIHLPKMADIGIVEYERQRGRIRLGHEFDRVEPYLYASRDSSVRWDRMYLVVGLVIAAVLVPGYLWSSTVASIPEEVWFGILVGICSFLLAVHLARSSEWIDAEWFRA